MKTRVSFVSNSSSSSFLVSFNDFKAFDFLKESRGYETFSKDVEQNENNYERVKELLVNLFEKTVYNYEWYLQSKKRKTLFFDEINPMIGFISICRRLHNDNKEVYKIIEEAIEIAKQSVEKNQSIFDSNINALAQRFAELLCEEGKKHWKKMAVVGYADDDGYFGEYMEHDFMYGEVAGEEPKGFDEFSIIISNEH